MMLTVTATFSHFGWVITLTTASYYKQAKGMKSLGIKNEFNVLGTSIYSTLWFSRVTFTSENTNSNESVK